MNKTKLIRFFKTREVFDIADFIAVKIESDNQYYIDKCRQADFKQGDVIDEETFKAILPMSSRPIILSDRYIDLDDKIN